MKEKLINATVWFLFIWGAVSFVRFAIRNTIRAVKAVIDRVKKICATKRAMKNMKREETVNSEEHTFVYV